MERIANISFRIFTLFIFITLMSSNNAFSEELEEIVNLKGNWKFSIGDNPEWSNPNFDHSRWDNIYVPASWESEGFERYNGYAWYRKRFRLNTTISQDYVFLYMGYIDDADEVFVNGKLVGGAGNMQPEPTTAYNIQRIYPVSSEILNLNGENTISVRVHDFYDDGGIVGGRNIGLYINKQTRLLEKDLTGYWNFETEEELNERLKSNTGPNNNKIFVPSYWDGQGYGQYDGKARYKTTFMLSEKQINQDLVMVMGFIDDIEVVYLNRQKIGSVIAYEEKMRTGFAYDQIFRGYPIPKGLLKADAVNMLTVVVYDKGGLGGIYKGPVGIATQDNFERLKEINLRYKSTFELFMESFWK